jgi:hypothetical protein
MTFTLVFLGLVCLTIGLIVLFNKHLNPIVSIIGVFIGVLVIFWISGLSTDTQPKESDFNTVVCVSEKKCYFVIVLARAPQSQTELMRMTKANAWQDAMLLDDTTGLKLKFK